MRITTLSLLFFMILANASGQNTMVTNLYFKNMNYLNPAAGLEDEGGKYSFQFYGKYKHVGNELWTKSFDSYFNHIGKIEKTSGFYSFSYLLERFSYFNRHALLASYTQVWKWGEHNYINAGVRGVFNFDHVDWDKLYYIDSRHGRRLYYTPDLDLGIRYGNKRLTVGVALKNVFSNTIYIDEKPFITNKRFWVADASYRFDIKDMVAITPYTLVRYEYDISFDLGVNVGYKDIISIGYQLRVMEIRHIYSLLAHIGKHFHLGFAVDHSTIHSDINFDALLRYTF
ncbi:type IX secretion system membrane protein PorP/SprF [Bacteroidales bacterium OttesenSCG-928-B11]|nr:type IX secretion system membrane protein PorP/SprF [Bacteroidales bacterium OttesenSCG-928-E04]MDL2308999.1 type IX secretion system membrane protein PorP/SprF [Bacteroidales bacterium OttesenSCG-928-C03]MDL2312206.1 type IX secretion system membrane protein PorP/SprF [Bacteroidales bacterium OttesenSCG-928-B11]MDL2326861.1 type IX secretion system membrane protein PorP/SprF [Bacteroidales bacterium OttesenSCG-928-A14]